MNIQNLTQIEDRDGTANGTPNLLLPIGGAPYWTQAEIDGSTGALLAPWAIASVEAFRQVVSKTDFPCTFATASEQQEQLVYAFVDTTREPADIAAIGKAIVSYLDALDAMPRNKADYHVLVVFVRPVSDCSLAGYADMTQQLLQSLHESDVAPWPADIPKDEDDPHWSFAFAGRALFVNVSTPANVNRRSRNVGPSMTLIISPREVFDRVAGPTDRGRKVRSIIRARTEAFDDGLAFAPWSSFAYGQGSVGTERSQYILSDDNTTPLEISIKQCPFQRKYSE